VEARADTKEEKQEADTQADDEDTNVE